MKKQMLAALLLLLLIPVVLMFGGLAFSVINPEIAAGHPNYVRNYHLLSLLKQILFLATGVTVAILWLLVCFLVVRSKQRSSWWLLLAALGPFGFAILAVLGDRAPAKSDRHEQFAHNLNWFARIGYQVCAFVMICVLAYEGMVLKRNLMIRYESFRTGMSTAQIIDQQNASSGMWAFAEGNEVIYFVILLCLVWPFVFNIVARGVASRASSKARR